MAAAGKLQEKQSPYLQTINFYTDPADQLLLRKIAGPEAQFSGEGGIFPPIPPLVIRQARNERF